MALVYRDAETLNCLFDAGVNIKRGKNMLLQYAKGKTLHRFLCNFEFSNRIQGFVIPHVQGVEMSSEVKSCQSPSKLSKGNIFLNTVQKRVKPHVYFPKLQTLIFSAYKTSILKVFS